MLASGRDSIFHERMIDVRILSLDHAMATSRVVQIDEWRTFGTPAFLHQKLSWQRLAFTIIFRLLFPLFFFFMVETEVIIFQKKKKFLAWLS